MVKVYSLRSKIVKSHIQRGQIFRPLKNDELEPLFQWFLWMKLETGVGKRPTGENNTKDGY